VRRRLVVLVALAAAGSTALAYGALPRRPAASPPRALRVCADPNNLPFSNQAEQGFENRIARLIAADLGAEVRYTWWAQRRGFVRNTLRAGECDLIPGVPARFEPVATTAPYYTSSYVFVTRSDLEPAIESLDDPRLRRLRIGVHLIGDDYANPPPVAALARRGIVRNVAGYSIYGDYRDPNPPARLVEAVARGEVDVAIVWGPLGGYFATREAVPLRVRRIRESDDGQGVPFVFRIAMGVRPEDSVLLRRVESVLIRRRVEVRRILGEYGVPLVAGPEEAT
jgi:mxaJ protein